MTIDEVQFAIDYLILHTTRSSMERSADKTAIKALGKQIPREPESVSYGNADGYPVWDYSCPECNHEFDDFGEFAYCPDCGQRILWELQDDEEEEEK